MRITKYKTVLDNERCNILVKEKATNYKGEELSTPIAVAKMLNLVFSLNKQTEEYAYMVAVDTKCKPIGVFEISHGTVNASLVTPREILIKALLVGAVSIIIAHNHPSGCSEPSLLDIKMTRRIKKACDLIGINLLDHLIVGDLEYYSFKEKNKEIEL